MPRLARNFRQRGKTIIDGVAAGIRAMNGDRAVAVFAGGELHGFLERHPFRAESWRLLATLLEQQHQPALALQAWREAALRDVRDDIVSAAGAERDYGVAISADGRGIDAARTASLRASSLGR